MKINYYEIKQLSDIYLEDSYVINISENNNSLTFFLEFVLTEKNIKYSPPKEGETYCYKKGQLIFRNLNEIKWLEKNLQAFSSINDAIDYGNIDTFFQEDGIFYLSGDWGDVQIIGGSVDLMISE
jgi:hypothetical protein